MSNQGFIATLQQHQPQVWATLKNAAIDGLIYIDEATDSITATNRLLWTYPGLHEVLTRIINDWAETATIQQNNLQEILQRLPKSEGI